MDPGAWVIVAVASVLAVFVTVMAFRGLLGILDGAEGRCATCGRIASLPLPPTSHLCFRCHAGRLLGRQLRTHH